MAVRTRRVGFSVVIAASGALVLTSAGALVVDRALDEPAPPSAADCADDRICFSGSPDVEAGTVAIPDFLAETSTSTDASTTTDDRGEIAAAANETPSTSHAASTPATEGVTHDDPQEHPDAAAGRDAVSALTHDAAAATPAAASASTTAPRASVTTTQPAPPVTAAPASSTSSSTGVTTCASPSPASTPT